MSTIGIIAVADLNTQIDFLCVAYRKLVGTLASGFGMGEPLGAYGSASNLNSLVGAIYGSNYDDVIDYVGKPARTLQLAMSAKGVIGAAASDLIVQYGRLALAFPPDASVVSLDTLLTYWNTGPVKNQVLQDANFYDIYLAARKVAPTPGNLYQEILQGAFTTGLDHLYTNALGKFVVTGAGAGNFTKPVIEGVLISDGAGGGTIDSSKYAGAVPQVRTAGLAGNGVLTVTATIWDPATKTIQVAKTLTFNIVANGVNNVVTGGTAPANSLIIVATGVAIAAGITAGTHYVEGSRPAGRALVA